jgi:hypothetical protein
MAVETSQEVDKQKQGKGFELTAGDNNALPNPL